LRDARLYDGLLGNYSELPAVVASTILEQFQVACTSAELAAMADKHDVSLAWLGRQAFLEFLAHYRNEQLNLPLRLEVRNAHGPRGDEHAAQ